MTSGTGLLPWVSVPRTGTSVGPVEQPAATAQQTPTASAVRRRRTQTVMGGSLVEREDGPVVDEQQRPDDGRRVRAVLQVAHRAVAEHDVQRAGVRRPPVVLVEGRQVA